MYSHASYLSIHERGAFWVVTTVLFTIVTNNEMGTHHKAFTAVSKMNVNDGFRMLIFLGFFFFVVVCFFRGHLGRGNKQRGIGTDRIVAINCRDCTNLRTTCISCSVNL